MPANKYTKALRDLVEVAKGKEEIMDALRQFEERPIEDWEQPGQITKIPGREEIHFGPTQASSGGGATRMVRDYSAFAPQTPQGIVELYDKFSKLFSEFEAVKAVVLSLKGGKEAGDSSEKAEYVEKALRYMKKAKSIIIKAEDSDIEGEEEADDTDMEDNLNKAEKALKAARDYLLKAEDEDDDEEDEKVEKALKTRKSLLGRLVELKKAVADRKAIVAKAEEAARKAKEDEVTRKAQEDEAVRKAKEEEDRKKAEEEARKAKGNDAGNQGDNQNPESGNQGGIPMTEKSVSEVMKYLMGVAAGQIAPAPTLQKGATVDWDDVIDNAYDGGDLTEDQSIEARSIVSRVAAAKAGVLDSKLVAAAIAKAHPNVRSIFSKVAAA